MSDHDDPEHRAEERQLGVPVHVFAPKPTRRRKAKAPGTVFVPAEVALVYTAEGWSAIAAPPAWWLEQQLERVDEDERPRGVLSLVPELAATPARMTACRPGSGPCGRRHEHGGARRTG